MTQVEIFKALFWISVGLISYTYFLYPSILFLLTSFIQAIRDLRYLFTRRERRKEISLNKSPMVSLLVAAYNEEKVIEEKLLNSLELNYPKDIIEIIVGSDGSTDKTNEIVKSYEKYGVKLLGYQDRRGKASVLNRLVAQARGDILIFSDANTIYSSEAIKKLVRHFDDPKIGCVSGELRLRAKDGSIVEEGLYWKYEVMLKFMESKIGSALGANGGIYAIRKNLFKPIPEDTIIDDFVIGMKVKEQGYRIIFDPEAVAYEDTAQDLNSEMIRRIRIGAGNFQSIKLTKKLLNPKMGFVAFAFWSHKLIRWFAPLFLFLAFICNLFLLNSRFYQILFILQIFFYFLSIVGYLLSKKKIGNIRILNLVYYFVSMNLALLLGFFKFITKTQKVSWKKTER